MLRLTGGTFTLSMWNGDRNDDSMAKFIKYLENIGMSMVELQTGENDDFQDLWGMITILKPK